MEIKYGDYRKRQINDVVRPGTGNGFDVRRPSVRYQSIGQLDDAYLRSRHLGAGARSVLGYTHIPPLASLHSHKNRYVSQLHGIWSGAKGRLNGAWAALISLAPAAYKGLSSVIAPVASRLPKRYTLARGLRTDWHTPAYNSLKLMVPAALILAATAILLPGQQEQPITVQNDNNTRTNKPAPTTAASSTDTGGRSDDGTAAANSGSGSGQAGGIASPNNRSRSTAVVPSGGATGGRGGGTATPSGGGGTTPSSGGGSTTPSTGGGSISDGGVLPALPATICTPGVQTKPVSTSGVCVN